MNIEVIIGTNLRRYRLLRGLSQSTLATESGITFQQIQKYEKGTNRIAASRLMQFAKILKVSIADLLNEHGDTENELTKDELKILEILRMATPETKKAIVNLIKSMG